MIAKPLNLSIPVEPDRRESGLSYIPCLSIKRKMILSDLCNWKSVAVWSNDLLEDLPHKIKGINPDKFDTLESFILTYDKQFSHIITDSMENRPEFLKDVFQYEDKYSYLIKEWDSSDEDYKYHVKIFRIDYELFNLEIKKWTNQK